MQNKKYMKMFEKIFSIKNEYKNNKKTKEVNIFGLKICIKRSELYDPTIFDIDIKKHLGIQKNKSHIHTVVLGSSHARDGFIPSPEIFNLGNSSQDLYRIYGLYKWLIQNKFLNLKNIIIYYDVFHPGFKLEKTCEAFKCIPYKYLFDIPYNKRIDKNLFEFEKKTKKYLKNNKITINNYYGESLRNVSHDTSITAIELVTKHLKNNKRLENQNIYLEKLIIEAYIQRHNVYIVLPPYKKEYNKCLPKQSEIFQDLFLLIKKYPQVKLLNFQYCMGLNDKDFDDLDHLSASGAEKLTKHIKEILYI